MLIVAAVWGRSLTNIILIIGIIYWTSTARLIRAQVKSVRERVYVKRARALGAGHNRLVFRHVLPQVMPLLVANTVLMVAVAIFAETAIAFLGLGDPSLTSWGLLIENAFDRQAISTGAWWAIVPPGRLRDGGDPGLHDARHGHRGRPEPAARVEPPVGAALPAAPAAGEGAAVSAPVLEARDLHVWFDARRRPRAARRARRLVRARARRALRAGRRVRLRQDDDDPGADGAPAARRRRSPAASCSTARTCWPAARRACSPHRWKDVAMVFQGAMNAFNPVQRIGRQLVEPMELHGTPSGKAARARARELLDLVGIPARPRRPLPARALRRHAPAGGDRDGPGLRAEGAPGRRADDGARRDGAGPDPGAAGVALGRARAGADPGDPRPAGGGPGVPAGGGDVRRPDRRDRADGHAVPRARPPVHAAAVRGDARPRRLEQVVSIPGAPPRLDAPLLGCPFRAALRPGVRTCADGRPRRRGRSASATRRHATGPRPVARIARVGARSSAAARGRGPARPATRSRAGSSARVAARRRPSCARSTGSRSRCEQGELLALVGESGCGKTTTAHATLRLLDAHSGSIRFDGTRHHAPAAARAAAAAPADAADLAGPVRVARPALPGERRSSRSRCWSTASAARRPSAGRRVAQALERAGLTPGGAVPGPLPARAVGRAAAAGGDRRRAWCWSPSCWWPTSRSRCSTCRCAPGSSACWTSLRRSGLGILMITHDLSTAVHYADRIAVMYLGRIVEEGPAREVVANPRHPYTRALVSVVPRPDPRHAERPQLLPGRRRTPCGIPSGCRFHPRCPIAEPRCSRGAPGARGGRAAAARGVPPGSTGRLPCCRRGPLRRRRLGEPVPRGLAFQRPRGHRRAVRRGRRVPDRPVRPAVARARRDRRGLAPTREDEPGSWTFEVVAVHRSPTAAFVEGRVHYPEDGRRFANLWQIELDGEGRATRYVEWWMEPRRPHYGRLATIDGSRPGAADPGRRTAVVEERR